MKKVICLVMALVCIFSLAGCGSKTAVGKTIKAITLDEFVQKAKEAGFEMKRHTYDDASFFYEDDETDPGRRVLVYFETFNTNAQAMEKFRGFHSLQTEVNGYTEIIQNSGNNWKSFSSVYKYTGRPDNSHFYRCVDNTVIAVEGPRELSEKARQLVHDLYGY